MATCFRYRARLVAQGFRQREFDSFNPDDIHSPVVHKNSLRCLLSVAAAENLRVYCMDVKSAFLQAPLKEKIYLKAPPGFASFSASGEEEVLELSQAIYGLKQSSSAFYDAASAHLISKGFESVLGDPCLFKRVNPDGSKFFAAVLVMPLAMPLWQKFVNDLLLMKAKVRPLIIFWAWRSHRTWQLVPSKCLWSYLIPSFAFLFSLKKNW